MNGFSPITPSIRWMIRKDLPAILACEEAAYGADSWSEEDFTRCLRQRNCIGMLAEQGDTLLGYMVYELHRDRLHLLNFVVHPDYQRRYIGAAMLDKLIGKLSQQRRTRITLLINEGNMPALRFFKAMGFMATHVVWDAFPDVGEDGYAMELRVGAAVNAITEQIHKQLVDAMPSTTVLRGSP